jgi:hypothetical protein
VQVRRGVYPLREAWRALYAMVQANMLRVAAETQTILPVCCDAYRPGGGSVWPKQLDDRPNSARNLVTGQEPGFQIVSAKDFAWQIASEHELI